MSVDFKWIFKSEMEVEDDKKYQEFPIDMYEPKTNLSLVIKKEEEFLRNYKS